MRFLLFFAVFSLALGTAFAASCPAGAEDCFLCGNEIPCSTDCQGKWDEASQMHISCECPQGEPCVCYCPYWEGEGTNVIGTDPNAGELSDEIAAISSLSGDVYIKRSASHQWEKVIGKIRVDEGYTIRTENGKATILFEDGCKVYIEGGTTLEMNELLNIPQKSTLQIVLQLIKGAIYSDVTARDGTSFEVRGEFGRAGAKGTRFHTSYFPETGSSAIKVYEGEVEVQTPNYGTYSLSENEKLTIEQNQFPSIENFNSSIEQTPFEEEAGGCSSAIIIAALIPALLLLLPPER